MLHFHCELGVAANSPLASDCAELAKVFGATGKTQVESFHVPGGFDSATAPPEMFAIRSVARDGDSAGPVRPARFGVQAGELPFAPPLLQQLSSPGM